MRLTNIIVSSLVLILFVVSAILFLWAKPGEFDEKTRTDIKERLSEQHRTKGLLIHRQNEEAKLIYLIGHEPITSRTGWIYIPPEATVMSPTLGRRVTIKQLYSDLSSEGFFTELQDILNLNLSFYIGSSDNALAEVIDLLGGISLTLRSSEPADSNGSNQRWMDGNLALQFSSEAYTERGIEGRRYRHKTVLLGVVDKLKQTPALLEQKQLISTLYDQLETNLSLAEFKFVLQPLAGLEENQIQFLTALIPETEPEQKIDSERVVNMLPPPIKQIINSSPRRDVIYVEILNGTNISGLAGRYREKLQRFDFIDVVKIDNADRFNYKESLFIDRSNRPQSAYRLKELLGHGSLKIDPSEDLLVDVTFILGEDLAEIPEINS